MAKSGIYCITNTTNGKIYIGSSVNVYKRLQTHFRELRRGVHHGNYIQRSYSKYGADSFRAQVLLYCEKFELYRYEQSLMDAMRPALNMSPTAGTCLGTKHTEESRRNMSIAHQGQVVSPEARAKMSKTRKGMKQTAEWILRRMQSRRNNGNYLVSEETREKMSNSAKNRRNKNGASN